MTNIEYDFLLRSFLYNFNIDIYRSWDKSEIKIYGFDRYHPCYG